MHENEFNFEISTVETLMLNAGISFKEIVEISKHGTDNRIFRIDDKFVIRLPRTEESSKAMEYEQSVLKSLHLNSKIKIPEIVYFGSPSSEYPFYFGVYKWIEGQDLYHNKNTNFEKLATDLAKFIKTLHEAKCKNAKPSSMGRDIKLLNNDFLKDLEKMDDHFDKDLILKVWNRILKASSHAGEPVFVHGDILPMNVIVENKALKAVIDFSYTGMGDPAVDLMPAWTIFSKNERAIFLKEFECDENAILRGAGNALWFAIRAFPYYKNTNKVIADIALKTLNEVLADAL